MKIKNILDLNFIPFGADLGLLVMRLGFGFAMLMLHGLGKLQGYAEMSSKFPDPLGVGSQTSLTLAVFAEVACAGLLAAGLFTRFAALNLAITMGVAFFMVHKGALSGEGSGEMALVYLIGFVGLFLSGGGAFSLDRVFGINRK
jgi:putative oxidoreductase